MKTSNRPRFYGFAFVLGALLSGMGVSYSAPGAGTVFSSRRQFADTPLSEVTTKLHLSNLNLSDPFDQAVRKEADLIDASFMRWTFFTRVRWNEAAGSYARPDTDILINRGQLDALTKGIPADKKWLAFSVALAHEKAHMIQFRVYGNEEAFEFPAKVAEAQADIMAAAFLWLRVTRQLLNPARPEEDLPRVLQRDGRDIKQFQEATLADINLLRRLARESGTLLSRSYSGHPSPPERDECVALGLKAGVLMTQLMVGQVDDRKLRQELKMRENEDFLGWSLRQAYQVTGIAEGAREKDAGAPLATSKEPLAVALRTALEQAEGEFENQRGKLEEERGGTKRYVSKLDIPNSLGTDILVEEGDAQLVALMYYERNAPADAETAWNALADKLDGYLSIRPGKDGPTGWRRRDLESPAGSKRQVIIYRNGQSGRTIHLTVVTPADGFSRVLLAVD